MGLFSKLFGDSGEQKKEKSIPWIELTDVDQLQEIKEASIHKTKIIFKHSIRCGISRMVKNQFEEDYAFNEQDADFYYLDLINNRAVSNAVEDIFQVIHESPQVLVIKNGVVVAHDSHGGINDIDLKSFI
jgi:bacillithiol system protein YtxJ